MIKFFLLFLLLIVPPILWRYFLASEQREFVKLWIQRLSTPMFFALVILAIAVAVSLTFPSFTIF